MAGGRLCDGLEDECVLVEDDCVIVLKSGV
jgi:hypothetical protein